ncbi:MAG: DnaA/Hda family protein [Pirellulaceae bacterium]
MAQEVNQSETDIAEQLQQLRLALVSRIGRERIDLWMPAVSEWLVAENQIQIFFENEFGCELAQKMLGKELQEFTSQMNCQVRLLVGEGKSTSSTSALPSADVATSAAQASHTHLNSETNRKRTSHRDSAPDPRQVERAARTNIATASTGPLPLPTAQRDAAEADSWQQFVAGESNGLATAMAKMVMADPGKMSPVFLHGPTGSGKSLLVAGIAEQLRVTRRLPRVQIMTSEQFLNDFTDGLRGGGLPMFRRKYRDVEALILEDVQFLLGKKSSITEVKNTLDNLLRMGKQIILTADRSLNELAAFGPELIARLRGGLEAPIFPLDVTTRTEVLKRFVRREGLDVDATIVGEIADKVSGDGRILSGIAKRLCATAAFSEEALDWESCWTAIADLVQATQPIVRIVDIDRIVCDIFGLESESLRSQTKIRRVSQPRMLAMFLARKYTPAAYKEIGQYFGKRRHSTVISAEKTVSNWLYENTDMELGRGQKVRDVIRQVESHLQVG